MTHLTRRGIAALVLAGAMPAAARAAEMPDAARGAILAAPAGSALDIHVAAVPASVRAVAFPIMADPGQPFEVTDSVSPGSRLPGGRLTWGLRLGRWYLLHSEFGGIAHAFYVRVYDLSAAPARPVFTAIVGRPFATLSALQAALRAGRLQGQ